jgi:hypothetical protein
MSIDLTDHVEDPDDAQVPDYRNYLVYVDESGIHGKNPYYGWGTLWIPFERRGTLSLLLKTLKKEHGFEGEVKWNKVKPRSEAFACELIDAILVRNWMMFHAILLHRSDIKTKLFKGNVVEARLHHLSTLIRNKISYFGGGHADKTYHLRVDPLPSPYRKEHEKIMNITNAMLVQSIGESKITSMDVVDSKGRAGVQIADLLLGAALSPWNAVSDPNSPKARVAKHLYSRLGWPDHRGGTFAREWKFNLWWLASAGEPRHAPGRPCRYHFPVRPYKHAAPR